MTSLPLCHCSSTDDIKPPGIKQEPLALLMSNTAELLGLVNNNYFDS